MRECGRLLGWLGYTGIDTPAIVKDAHQRIHHWWKQAWQQNEQDQRRFFAKANLALPGLSMTNDKVDDVFEALLLQRDRLKQMQLIGEC